MTMLWTGSQSAIEAAAALCDASANTQPQTRGDGSPVPESERMTMRWAEPQQCEHCEMWTLPAPPAEYGMTLPAGVTEMTAEEHVSSAETPVRISEVSLRVQHLEERLGVVPSSSEETLIERIERLESVV